MRSLARLFILTLVAATGFFVTSDAFADGNDTFDMPITPVDILPADTDEDGQTAEQQNLHSVISNKEPRDKITLQVEPAYLNFDESFTISATSPRYPYYDQWYFVNIIDPNGTEIYSIEWYTHAPFVHQVWTGSPYFEFHTNGEYAVTVELAEHGTQKRTGQTILEEFFTVSGVPEGLEDKQKEFGATGRSFNAFRFVVDNYYQHGGHAYFVAEPGSKSVMPINVKNKSEQYAFTLHPTFGNQKNPPPQPEGVNIYFEPNRPELKPEEEQTVNLVVELDRNVKPNVYDVGIVGFWEEPGGFMGSSIRLHVGDYYGPKALPSNFELPSPLLLYKESNGRTDIIECKGAKKLVLQQSGGHPACVGFESIAKLVDRNWIKSGTQFLHVADLKPVYYADEEISFGIHKIGLTNCDWIAVKIFDQEGFGDGANPILTDTAERICLKEARFADSPEKSWKLYTEFPQEKTEPIALEPGEYVMQVSSEGSATIEREFRVTERVLENED